MRKNVLIDDTFECEAVRTSVIHIYDLLYKGTRTQDTSTYIHNIIREGKKRNIFLKATRCRPTSPQRNSSSVTQHSLYTRTTFKFAQSITVSYSKVNITQLMLSGRKLAPYSNTPFSRRNIYYINSHSFHHIIHQNINRAD